MSFISKDLISKASDMAVAALGFNESDVEGIEFKKGFETGAEFSEAQLVSVFAAAIRSRSALRVLCRELLHEIKKQDEEDGVDSFTFD